MYFQEGNYFQQSLISHEKLYQAIYDQDKDRAAKTMEEILLEGREELTKLLS